VSGAAPPYLTYTEFRLRSTASIPIPRTAFRTPFLCYIAATINRHRHQSTSIAPAMYHAFFGLRESAFSIAVNPRYLYMSEQHREALAHLLFGLQGGGFVQLTGEVGTGKTTLIRCLLEQLPEQTEVALILNPMASVPELLASICDELGARYISDQDSAKSLTDALYQKLLHNHRQGRQTLLLIDEAQTLSAEALEQVRLLTNLETETSKLLNIILVGQPELQEFLARPALRQLSQRITARFHLQPLSPDETRAYIEHRLQVAGLEPGRHLLSRSLIEDIHQFSGGIPRLINIICERMLLGAYGQDRQQLDKTIFNQARREITGQQLNAPKARTSSPWLRRPGFYALTTGLAALALAVFFWLGPVGEVTNAGQEDPQTTQTIKPSGAEAPASAAKGFEEQPPTETDMDPDSRAPDFADDLSRAQRQLAEHLTLSVPSQGDPCSAASRGGHHCQTAQLDTWNALMALDRPAVLTLVDEARKLAYAPLLGLDQDNALILNGGKTRTLAWRSLASQWNGQVHYFAFQPPGFDGSLGPGDTGPAVSWLARQFARMDNKDKPLTDNRYNTALQTRVEIFQREYQLQADGLFGENTLRQLALTLGLDPRLKNPQAPREEL